MGIAIPQLAPASLDRASGAQVIDGSLKFDEDKNTYLKVTPGTNGNRRTWTWSGWVKRNTFGSSLMSRFFMGGTTSTSAGNAVIAFYQDRLFWQIGSSSERITTNRLFRDTGWYHIVVALDTTQGTSSNTVKIYVNGVQETSFSTSGYPSQNTESGVNSTQGMILGAGRDSSGNEPDGPFDGQIVNAYLIDGQALDPSEFGFTDPLTNTWKPKKFDSFNNPNNGTTWSNLTTASSGSFEHSLPKTNLFDGIASNANRANLDTVGASIDIDFSSNPINVKNTISIWSGKANLSYSINGGAYVNYSDASEAYKDIPFTGTLTSLSLKKSDEGAGASAIKIDGYILLDGKTDNSFYLPFDGNSLIGEDKSGKGNDLTPINFGGSVALDKATGALPILNTVSGGNYATVGVRSDTLSSNLRLAVPHAGVGTDMRKDITGSNNLMTSFSANNSTYAYPTDASGSPYSNALYINGTGDYPRINFTAGDFNFMHNQDDSGTVEFWFYNGAYSTEGYIFANVGESSQVGLALVMGSSTTFNCYIQRGVGGGSQNAGTSTLLQNEWSHIAVTKQKVGSNVHLKVYVNGVNTASNTSITATDLSNSNSAKTYWQTGSSIGHESSRGFTNAYISDIRIYNTVKYTGDFVPASTNPDILPDTPSGVSGGSKLTKITDGAVAFEGNATTKLTLADSTDFTFGTNDFCIEFFYYNKRLLDNSSYDIIFDCMGSNRSGIQLAIEADNDYRIEVGDGSNNWIWQSTGLDSKSRKWTHFALTREGSTFRAFEDGVLIGTQTSSTAVGDPRSSAIGGWASDDSTNYGFNGYISNFRIVNGSAVYTAAFTPSTAPLTNVTNTKLLTCQSTSFYAAVAPLVSGVNNGTVWSSSLTADSLFRSSSYPAKDAFNGVTKTSTEDCAATPQVAGQGFTFLFGGGVPFTTLQMQCDHNNGATVTANGVNITSQLSSGSLTNTTITGVTSPLTSLSVVSHNGDAGYLGSVTIDGTMLVDPLVPNGDAGTTNFNPFNTDINTVRGQETGYPTWNPLDQGSGVTLSEGNSKASVNGSTNSGVRGTMTLPKSGKYFFAIEMNVIDNAADAFAGLMYMQQADTVRDVTAGGARLIVRGTGAILNDSTGITGLYFVGDGYDELGVAVDCDANTVQFYVNGAPSANAQTPSVSITEGWAPHCACSSGTSVFTLNAGQKPFKFPPPDGFQPLNTANTRPVKVISRPDQYVGVTTYSGNNTAGHKINVGFDPDFVIFGRRTNTAEHFTYDTVRGAGYAIKTSSDGQQEDQTGSLNFLKAFVDDGFTLGTDQDVNSSSDAYVTWNWKAGGSKNTFNVDDVGYASAAAAGLTGGDITPSGASVGTKQGFSIIQYAGTNNASAQTIPHGLLQKPDFMIVKQLTDNSTAWTIYHSSLGATKYLEFDTGAEGTATGPWNDTEPTSSLFTVGSSYNNTNRVSRNFVSYHWHNVPGLQKFGKYTGNNSSDGPYVELGFRPAIVWIKGSDFAANWFIFDNQREFDFNPTDEWFNLDTSSAANAGGGIGGGTAVPIDFLSNGFKVRFGTAGYINNTSSYNFVYCAWAEAPSVDLYGGGANAR